MARESIEGMVALRGARSEKCMSTMKAFLCTLYHRPCNSTGGGVKPVCFYDCTRAYENCGFDDQYRNLQCGELVKAGWVAYSGELFYPAKPNGASLRPNRYYCLRGIRIDVTLGLERHAGRPDWNTGQPACEQAMLRSDLSLGDMEEEYRQREWGPFIVLDVFGSAPSRLTPPSLRLPGLGLACVILFVVNVYRS